MMTDEERQDIRHMTATLRRRAAVLCTYAARVCTSLADQCTQLAAHQDRLQAFVHQQRSRFPVCCPTRGCQRDPEIMVLTNLLSRLRRPYGL